MDSDPKKRSWIQGAERVLMEGPRVELLIRLTETSQLRCFGNLIRMTPLEDFMRLPTERRPLADPETTAVNVYPLEPVNV